MAPGVSLSILVLFLFTVLGVFGWLSISLYTSWGKKGATISLLLALWLSFQGWMAYSGFYLDEMTMPPHFLFAVGPPVAVALLLALVPATRKRIIAMPMLPFIWLMACRIPVEICLWGLCKAGLVPQLMTFEGGNLDILSGITAPIVGFLWLQRRITSRGVLIWNFAALALLINIVIRAVLSAQTPFQKIAFAQPNVAVMHFPFIWLPSFVVPVVFFCHLAIYFSIVNKSPNNLQ